MSEIKEVKMERLARLDLAYQAAECALADAFALQARIVGEVSLADMEAGFGLCERGEIADLKKVRKIIAWLGMRRRLCASLREELAAEDEARRA